MTTSKNIFVFSTPRTGSVIVGEILCRYLIRKFGYKGHLHEMLNPYHYNIFFEDRDGYRINNQDTVDGGYREEYELNENGEIVKIKNFSAVKLINLEEETVKRVKLLKSTKHNYFVHSHAWPLHNAALEYLTNDVACVRTARRNRFDQILSYGLAYHTKIFRRVQGSAAPVIVENSIVMPENVIKDLILRIKKWDELNTRWTTFPIVYYEDFLELESPIDVLGFLGFADYKEFVKYDELSKMSIKAYPTDKEKYFSNIDQIRKLYDESKL